MATSRKPSNESGPRRRSRPIPPKSRDPARSVRAQRPGTPARKAAGRAPKGRPRRRLGARRGPSRIRWDRLGRIALVTVIFIIAVSYLNPALDLFRSHGTAAETRESLSALAAENARLKEHSETAMEPSRLTREARRQGMVVPGERPYVIRDLGG